MESDKRLFEFLTKNMPNAFAIVKGGSDYPNINGKVEFYALTNGVIVVADIDDLPSTPTSIFAFHIHEGQSCEDNFSQTGGHYNPENLPHPSHSGDMPPLFSNDGCAWLAFYTERISLNEIIGKTVIIHDGVDDFTTQPAGNSGQKIACGVIVKQKH